MILDKLIGVIAPHQCVGCSLGGTLLCASCASALVPAISRCYRCHQISENFRTCASCRRKSKLYSVTARTRYSGASEALVQKLKFGQAPAAASDIASLLTPLIPDASNLIITHLPTAGARVRSRGYDQAQLIARQLAASARLPYASLLARTSSERQVGAGRASRFEHASHMFRARNSSRLVGASVVIIDDVITTGASLEAAAALLRASGARRIYGLVFCQA